MRSLTWLHFSDLHFCERRSFWDTERILDRLSADFHRLRKRYRLRPQLVFFTGDAAYGHLNDGEGFSLTDQYDGVRKFFHAIRGSFHPEIPANNLFIVPGNHDVNRLRVSEALNLWFDQLARQGAAGSQAITRAIADQTNDWQAAVGRLREYGRFLESKEFAWLLSDKGRLLFTHQRDVAGVRVGIAGLNSAWSSGRADENGKLWLAARWQIQTLANQLRRADVKIALLHHPPGCLVSAERPDAEQQLQSEFDFCLHGHDHSPWVVRYSAGGGRIAAGACYGGGDAETGYNIVRLDLDEGRGQIWLRKFESAGKGRWGPLVVDSLTDDEGICALPALPAKLSRTARPRTPRSAATERLRKSPRSERRAGDRESARARTPAQPAGKTGARRRGETAQPRASGNGFAAGGVVKCLRAPSRRSCKACGTWSQATGW